MRQVFFVLLLISLMIGILYGVSVLAYPLIGEQKIISPISDYLDSQTSLEEYAIENLRIRAVSETTIEFGETEKETNQFVSKRFSFVSDDKKVTGLAHIPENVENAPVIVMFRGYVDPDMYEPGVGTRRAGEYFAQNGFITLSPDFLGFGESDMPSIYPLKERFERYTTGLSLLKSVSGLNNSLKQAEIDTTADTQSVGLWGHSNGGHIAIAMLEITGKNYPTTLWAPVSKPFPYSVLYYTDEYEDQGKALRKLIADFEKDYNIVRYSPTTYLHWINAPIILHQGGSDEAVPQKWSDEFYELLNDMDKDVTYYTYPGNDHNLMPNAWNTVVRRDVIFFREHLGD